MTYGDLKLRLTQAFPGVSLDLIEGWINDRYKEILAEITWSRMDVMAVLETTAPYTTGTIAVTAGSRNVTLTGGTWSSLMNGHALRVKEDQDFYELTVLTNTTGLLDRNYDGATSTAASYSVSQFVYVLPDDCRLLEDDAFNGPLGQLTRFTHQQIDAFDPLRNMLGVPQVWASYMDANSVPPPMQVELWPWPDRVMSLPFTYQSAAGDLTAEATLLQVWMQPTALVEGVTSRIKAHLKDYTGAQFHAALATSALKTMRGDEAAKLAPGQLGLTSYYVGYRTKRWNR